VACLAGACVDEPATSEETQALWWDDEPRAEPAIPWDEMTALQKHVSFFDYDGDGYITVTEDYRGLRALGIDPVSASLFAFAINAGLGTSTMGYPSLTISLWNIDDGVHGSDTGIYDSEGNFVEAQFDLLFDEWDLDGSDGLDPVELAARTVDDAELWDLFGITASVAEFGLLFAVAAEDGELSRDRMRGFYDGTLFYDLAEERADECWWGWWL
jgi:peroxygenase